MIRGGPCGPAINDMFHYGTINMKPARILLAFGIAVLTSSAPSRAGDFTTASYGGTVNWTSCHATALGRTGVETDHTGLPTDRYDGSVRSLNSLRAETYREAREAAVENLVSALKTIQADPERSFAEMMRDEEFTQERLAAAIHGSLKTVAVPVDHFSSECRVTLRLGDLIAALPYEFPGHELPVIDDTPIRTNYTSLIVDARGLGIKPMLFPSVYNEDGLEIYGRIYIDGRHAASRGIASYCYNEDEAMKNGRAGRRPFYTVALKNSGGCPVISHRDAKKVLSGPETRKQLKKCMVIIILDRKPDRRVADAGR